MTREEKKEELIGLFCTGAIYIGDLIDECFDFGQQQQQWVSVEEAFPPKDGVYLVCTTDGSVQLAYHYTGLEMSDAVTHWMPIPQPRPLQKMQQSKKKEVRNENKRNQQQIIGTADHIKTALDVMNKKGGEKC